MNRVSIIVTEEQIRKLMALVITEKKNQLQ